MKSAADLAGQHVIITGASSGIGHALARQLASRGASLLLNARRREPLDQLAEEFPNQILIACGDLSQTDTQQAITQLANQHWQHVDLLVNNAGVTAMGPFIESAGNRLRKVMELNFFAVTELTRACYPLLKAAPKGCVLNVSSVLGHRAVPLKTDYCASKFALHGWSDALRSEWRHAGIDVVLVSPSTTDTEFFDRAIEDTTKRRWKGAGAASPEKVARAAIRAWKKRQHEVILTPGGKALVWLDRLCPTLADWIVARFG